MAASGCRVVYGRPHPTSASAGSAGILVCKTPSQREFCKRANTTQTPQLCRHSSPKRAKNPCLDASRSGFQARSRLSKTPSKSSFQNPASDTLRALVDKEDTGGGHPRPLVVVVPAVVAASSHRCLNLLLTNNF